jgi:hypothetical protein
MPMEFMGQENIFAVKQMAKKKMKKAVKKNR